MIYSLLVFGVSFLVSRSPEKAAWLSIVFCIYVFAFGHLYNLIGDTLFHLSIGFVKFFILYTISFAVIGLYTLKSKLVPDPWLLLLPVSFLLLFNGFSIISSFFQVNQHNSQSSAGNESVQFITQDLPDIYYIVLDAYARDDILRDVISYDNSDFLNELKGRGFYLPECAFSNYDGTILTLMSVLNSEMLDDLGSPKNSQGTFIPSNISLIHDNSAARYFRSRGYQFVTGRGYASFNDITTSDVYLNYALDQGIKDDLAEKRFTNLYLNTTIFRVISELYKNNPEAFSKLPVWLAIDSENEQSLVEGNFWYLQNNYMFEKLKEIPERPGSFFVYAHINAPHGPYVYRADGSFRYPLDAGTEQERYADAITYINKQMLEVIDAILEKSSPLPIIIIQGDHGIHTMTVELDKHKILSAYYLPGNLNTPPYETITPVNNFRLIYRNYFDSSVSLLPDTLWVKHLNNYHSVTASCDLKP